MLGELYGTKFAQTFGAKPGAMWRRVIADLSDDQLEAGMEALMSAGSAFPPSLPEFRSVCLGDDETGVDEGAAQLLAYELIPSFDRANQSRVALEAITRKNLDRARALLAGTAQPTGREQNVMGRLDLPGTDLVRAPR